MDNLELLGKLFGDKLVKSETGDYGRPCMKLEETTSKSNYSVTIEQVPENAVAIKTDSFPNLQHFFECFSSIGQCCRADFVVITDDQLVFIELCETKKSTTKIKQQLKGAQCVVEYCRSVGKEFYQCNSFLEDLSSYFVSINHIGQVKKPSNKSQGKNDTPNKFLKISSPNNIQFKRLCCKK